MLVDPELDDWLDARARAAGTSKSAVVREAVAEQRTQAEQEETRRVDDFLDYLRAEVWRHVPRRTRRRRLTKEEREALLGIGPEGY